MEKKAFLLLVPMHTISVKITQFLPMHLFLQNKYYIRSNLICDFFDVVYLVECINYKSQYVGSDTSFKQCFYLHKTGIKTKKIVARLPGTLILFAVT